MIIESRDTRDKIAHFFNTDIKEAEFAAYLRGYLHATMMLYLQSREPQISRRDVREGYFWPTEFVDLIDPPER